MKILHVVPSYIPAYRYGGPVEAVHSLASALSAKGHDVTVFTTNIDGDDDLDVPTGVPVKKDGVDVIYYPVKRPRAYCYSPDLGRAVKERAGSFDVVHIHSVYLYPTLIASYWCRRLGKPYLINPFGALDPRMIKLKGTLRKRLYISLIERRNVNGSSAIHAASEYEKAALRSFGFNTSLAVVSHGIDTSRYNKPDEKNAFMEKYPSLKDKKIVLFLGRMHPKKGLELLAGAFRDVAFVMSKACLIIAGSGEPKYEAHVKEVFSRGGLDEKVIFTGLLTDEDKIAALKSCDVFVLTSYGENFGIAVLEAMACGVPVIVSDRVGLCADIEEYGAGIVIDCNQDEIAAAISRMLRDGDLRATSGSRGKALVEDRFTMERIVNRMIAVYKEVLKE